MTELRAWAYFGSAYTPEASRGGRCWLAPRGSLPRYLRGGRGGGRGVSGGHGEGGGGRGFSDGHGEWEGRVSGSNGEGEGGVSSGHRGYRGWVAPSPLQKPDPGPFHSPRSDSGPLPRRSHIPRRKGWLTGHTGLRVRIRGAKFNVQLFKAVDIRGLEPAKVANETVL